MRKHNSGAVTHKHSKMVSRPSGGYSHLNGRLGSKTSPVARPDVAYSTGSGRNNVANSTIKNHA
jgi:hypothetical protein